MLQVFTDITGCKLLSFMVTISINLQAFGPNTGIIPAQSGTIMNFILYACPSAGLYTVTLLSPRG